MGSHIEFFGTTGFIEAKLLLASFVLCSLIGFERQFRQKSAGYRTHVLVGIGTYVFTLVSAYGFAGVLENDVRLDPSRIAAQIVSGIGFLGAGVIFKGRNMVRGLTTADHHLGDGGRGHGVRRGHGVLGRDAHDPAPADAVRHRAPDQADPRQ